MHLLTLSLCVLKHPAQTFALIKANRHRFKMYPAVILIALCVIVRIASIFATHFPLTAIDVKDMNVLFEVGIIIVPLVSFAICSFALSSVLDGSSKLSENVMAVAYAMLPYILLTLPLAFFTRLLEIGDRGLYTSINSFIFAWVLLLMFIAVKVINEYTLAQTVFSVVLTLVIVVLFWCVLLLIAALAGQFIMFVTGIYRELRFTLFGG